MARRKKRNGRLTPQPVGQTAKRERKRIAKARQRANKRARDAAALEASGSIAALPAQKRLPQPGTSASSLPLLFNRLENEVAPIKLEEMGSTADAGPVSIQNTLQPSQSISVFSFNSDPLASSKRPVLMQYQQQMGQYRSYPGNLNYQNPLARLQSPLLGLGSLPPFDARSQNLCGECGQPKPPLTTTDRYAGLGPKFVYGGSEWYRPVKSVEVHNNQAISNTNRQVIPQSNQHALSDQIDIYPVVDTDGTEEEPYDLPKSRHNHALYYTTKGEERLATLEDPLEEGEIHDGDEISEITKAIYEAHQRLSPPELIAPKRTTGVRERTPLTCQELLKIYDSSSLRSNTPELQCPTLEKSLIFGEVGTFMPSSPPQKTGSIEYPRHIMGPDPMSCDDIFKMFQSSSPLCGKQLSLRDHTTDTEKSTLGQELTTRFTSLHPLRDNVFTQNAPRQKLDFISDNKNHTTCSSLQSDTPEWRARSEPHVSLISINKQQNLDRILSSPIHEQVPGWSFRSASLAPLPSRQNIRGFMSSPPRSALTEWYPEKNTYASVLEGQNSHSFMPFASVANASTKRSLTPCLGQQPPLSSNSINSNNMSVNSISSDTLRFNNMSFNHIYMPVPPPMVAQAAVPKRKALQDLPSKRNVKKTRVGEYKDGDRVGESAPEIGVMNKGRKLLEKMGWKKGMGLGTGDGGITSPYMPKIRLTKAGL